MFEQKENKLKKRKRKEKQHGVSEKDADTWLSTVRSSSVQSVQAATWNKCGGAQNAYVTLKDGSRLCARSRTPQDRLVLGEVLSYWLSRRLGLDCVPPVTLTSSEFLLRQRPGDFRSQNLTWNIGQPIALTLWLDRIDSNPNVKVLMPQPILEAYRSGKPITAHDISRSIEKHEISWNRQQLSWNNGTNESIRPSSKTSAAEVTRNNTQSVPRSAGLKVKLRDLVILAQWGTMIIFDYLTGNYDRVASMQDGAERENDPHILEESIRNLRPSDRGAKLWLLDNESGLLDAYTVLYLKSSRSDKFLAYHEAMLRTVCVFQRGVIRAVNNLHAETVPHRALLRYAAERDKMVDKIARDEGFRLFKENIAQRLDNVVKWIKTCEGMLSVLK
ncbi:four-jointed box protein 1 [Elysia marginata]|uniref:Four-jointed box protein 1 n=1 Tax=Elysia marginata TaxID=1093978 RepID=A0AAV4J485_9GAST|nr:four-jointed box protein 1 [Elysia marginata]